MAQADSHTDTPINVDVVAAAGVTAAQGTNVVPNRFGRWIVSTIGMNSNLTG
jgi:hypothetical protein